MKPVAWTDGKLCLSFAESDVCPIPLYTAPRELSDDEIADVAMHCSDMDEYGNSKLDEVAFAKELLKKASEK
jgi:hypothetical protein